MEDLKTPQQPEPLLEATLQCTYASAPRSDSNKILLPFLRLKIILKIILSKVR
jgi:hypothetical protein